MADGKPLLIFTLIHGTFAKNATWVKDGESGSEFRGLLRSHLDPELRSKYEVVFDDTVQWGHDRPFRFLDNTIKARLRGAKLLADHIGATSDPPGSRRYIVAHSHGGNIALYALRDEDVRKKISGVFCMATPFLFSREVEFGPGILIFSAAVVLVASIAWSSKLPLALAILLWIYFGVFLLIATVIRFSPYGKASESSVSPEKRLEAAGQGKARLRDVEFPPKDELSGMDGKPRMWVIAVPKDEVGWMMRWTHCAGRWSRRNWKRTNWIGNWLIAFYMLMIFPARLIAENTSLDDAWIDTAARIFDKATTPILFAGTVLVMAMAVLRLSFAFDSVGWFAHVDTFSKRTPWLGATVEEVPPDPDSEGRLRHTKVQRPAALKIAEILGDSPTAP